MLRVVPNSPAAAAGVQVGEMLVSADGKPVKRTADLLAAVEQKQPKDKLALQLKGPTGRPDASTWSWATPPRRSRSSSRPCSTTR